MASDYLSCKRCRRGFFAGDEMRATGICKMCREHPSWLTDEIRERIARSDQKAVRFGVSFKKKRTRDHAVRPTLAPVTRLNSHIMPGQKWVSADPRDTKPDGSRRCIHVREVAGDRAIVGSYWEKDGKIVAGPIRRDVKLSSFEKRKGRGFDLVERLDSNFHSIDDRNPYQVAAGQKWRALDPRRNGAVIEIARVDESLGKAFYIDKGGKERDVSLYSFRRIKGRGYEPA